MGDFVFWYKPMKIRFYLFIFKEGKTSKELYRVKN
jgi:hypothetical protein